MQEDAERTIRDWETKLKEEELAEKRRVAPGWLDREEKILQPTKTLALNDGTSEVSAQDQTMNIMDQQAEHDHGVMQQPVQSREGDELDRAFGGMSLKSG